MRQLQARAYDLAARFPNLGIYQDIYSMSAAELSGLIAYLLRLIGERMAVRDKDHG